ncbi:cyclic nucleotide-gated ion channel 1-like [Tripterygium wilfordii]|uniref:cyclic nucleotide-gated ion channel 1-like n=1 Tax=Tripterygium wilfordii TaxID=458696 RepID=UPI0018F83874|nr:cyclic nucleotide-gated ion channel 1-like [Tripterygium wilfordii]
MGSNTRDVERGKSRENPLGETDWKLVLNQHMRRFFMSVKWVKILIVLLAIEVSLLDPLFFYILVINDQQKCVRLDKKLGTAVMVFRSLIDSFYVIYIIAQLHIYFSVPRSRKDQRIRLGKFFLIDFLAVLPLPQVVILIIPAMRGSRFLNAMYLLRSVVLCQFVPRCFRAYLFITSGTFGEPVEARFKFSPLFFLLGINVIGALWYFLSIQRLVQCWTKACETHAGCVNSFYCKDNISDHTSLKDFCPMDTQKNAFFDFGIFSDALQSRVVEMTYFPKKFLYCFSWSLQNLSGFGQNLKTSTYIWESLFAIFMSILGMLLFLLLIGNLQTFMDSRRKMEQARNRWKAIESIEKWPPLKNLAENLKQDITKYLKYNWEKNTTDAGLILLELPPKLKRRIERAFSVNSLKNVKAFKGIGENFKDDLYKSIELKLFDEGEDIVQRGNTIDNMVFIVEGKLEARSSLNEENSIKVLKDGDHCGEEVTWDVFNDEVSFEPWVSTMTIKALTRVYALVLPADKVRDFLRHLHHDVKRSARHEFGFYLLNKVMGFKSMGREELNVLSDAIKLQLFEEGDDIIKAGTEIYRVVLMVQGKLEARSSRGEIIDSNEVSNLCGEKLVHAFLKRERHPLSTVTVKTLTRVRAIVLPAADVGHCLIHVPIFSKWVIQAKNQIDKLMENID